MELDRIDFYIGLVLGALGLLAYFKGAFKWVWRKVVGPRRGSGLALNIPNKTLAFTPMSGGRTCWWGMGSTSGEPAMQVTARYNVANLTKIGIVPTVARMRKPQSLGSVFVREVDSRMYGRFTIPPGATTEMDIGFWLVPPIRVEGESLVADVAVLDQFGNEHWIRRIEFKSSQSSEGRDQITRASS